MRILFLLVAISISFVFYFINQGENFKHYIITHIIISIIFIVFSLYVKNLLNRIFKEIFGTYKSDKFSDETINRYLKMLNLDKKEVNSLESALLISNSVNYFLPFLSFWLGNIGLILWVSGTINIIFIFLWKDYIYLFSFIIYYILMIINGNYFSNMRIRNAIQLIRTSNNFKFERESLYHSYIDGKLKVNELQNDLYDALISLNKKMTYK